MNSNRVKLQHEFIIIIFSSITVFAGALFVHQPGANPHAPGASVTQVNHSVYTLSRLFRGFAQISACRFFESLSQ